MIAAPISDIDVYSDESILDPYPVYRALRDLGPAVWMPRHSIYVLARYDEVSSALRDHFGFSSASGVSANEQANAGAIGTLIASDPPGHDKLRKAMAAPLSPSAMAQLRPRIQAAAHELVESLVDRGHFDVVPDLAQVLPVSIVSRLVGLPEEGRENMLRWAAATFDLLGAANPRSAAALPHVLEMRAYAAKVAHRGGVIPGGWADQLLDLVDQGHVEQERVSSLLRDFMAPSLDTTIFATASMIWLLGTHIDQWQALVDDPSLVRNAVSEAVRMESPVRGFSRRLTVDTNVSGVDLPAGARVLILYASANRDERKWDAPERFDIRRRVPDHVGFGFGVHSCAGMHLARLEMESILSAFIARVASFHLGTPVWALNNTLRGLSSLPITVVPR